MGGAVTGPASSTDKAIARWNGTSGTEIEDSEVIVDDSGHISNVTDPSSAQDAATKNYVDTNLAAARYTRMIGFTTGVPELGKQTGYFTCPVDGQIEGWSFAIDLPGSATVEVWKVPAGTASPTSADSNQHGGGIHLLRHGDSKHRPDRLHDYDGQSNDTFAFNLSAFLDCTEITFQLHMVAPLSN